MWDKDPVSFIDDVVLKDGSKLIKDIATDMANGVIDLAPIDTTNYVGNTNVSLGAPDYSYVEGKTIGRGGAKANAMSAIDSLPDDRLFTVAIANGTPYGKYLEWGRSRQAPNGVYLVTYMAVSMWYR